MDTNNLFKWIWRANGLLILATFGLAFCIMILGVAEDLFKSDFKDDKIINVAEDPKGEEKWELGSPTYIYGNDYLLLPLVSENRESKATGINVLSSADYSRVWRDPAKNILFLNSKTNESFWLFDDTERLILNTEQFPYHYGDDVEGAKSKAIFYELVSSDSDGDGILTYDDKLSLTMTKPDGGGYTVVLDEFDRIISKTLVDNNMALVVYLNNGVGMSVLLDLATFKVISSKKLPRIKNS